MERVRGLRELGDVQHSEFPTQVNTDLDDTGAYRSQGLLVIRIESALHQEQLVAGASSCRSGEGPQSVQRGSDEHQRLFGHGINILLLIYARKAQWSELPITPLQRRASSAGTGW